MPAKVRKVKGVPLSDKEYHEYRRLSHYDRKKAESYLASRDREVRREELSTQNVALRKQAAKPEEPRNRKVGDVALTEKQYRDYQKVQREDPGKAQALLALYEKPGQNVARKSGRYLTKDEMNNYEYLVGKGMRYLAEQAYGKKPRETAEQATVRTSENAATREAERAKRESRARLAQQPVPGSAAAAEQTVFRQQDARAKANTAPSQRDTYKRSATTQFLDANGMPMVSKQQPQVPVKAYGFDVPKGALVWLGTAGGVVAPSRGHMNDPDAPGGRNAPRETDLVRSMDDLYGEIDNPTIWTKAKIMKFQADQGLTVTGVVGTATRQRWEAVLTFAARKYAAGQKVSPYAMTDYRADADAPDGKGRGGGAAAPGEAGGGPRTRTETRLTNRSTAKALLNATFRAKLGRAVTEEEVNSFVAALNSSEKKAPVTEVGETNEAGSLVTGTTSGGVNPEQFAEDWAMSNKGGEANARMVGVDYMDAALKAIGAPV